MFNLFRKATFLMVSYALSCKDSTSSSSFVELIPTEFSRATKISQNSFSSRTIPFSIRAV